jgi:peptidoglycan/LPS O-acetylase OafA/YrhL
MKNQSAENIPSLNGIRAISVLIVVLSHSELGKIVPGGLGVTVFFFLSGYLITTLMLAERDRVGHIDILSFYARRVFRLIPPLLVTLAIAYTLTYWGFLSGQITWHGALAQILYFANYYMLFFEPGNSIPAGTGVLWSLAVEEHFYIFYPLVMTLLLNGAPRGRTIGILFAAACVIVLAWRIYLVHLPNFSDSRTYYASDTRIDSIIYGCILAICFNPMRDDCDSEEMSLPQWVLFIVAVGTLLTTLVYRDPVFRETFRYSLQGVALMPIFYFAVRFHGNLIFQTLNSNWLTKIGIYSYSIYLIHDVVINLILANVSALPNLVLFSIVLILSIIYAAAIDYFVDPYFRMLRKRFRASARGAQRATQNQAKDIN